MAQSKKVGRAGGTPSRRANRANRSQNSNNHNDPSGLSQRENSRAAKEFAENWKGKGYEKGECNKFWLDLLSNVFGVKNFANYIEFEKTVKISNTSFIDAYIPSTKVLIEQKGIKINLDEKERQSDGSELTPYEQAKRYFDNQGLDKKPRWIVVCNFAEFCVYDMNLDHPEDGMQKIMLADLEKDYHRLQFLVNTKKERIQREEDISTEAGKLVARLYDALILQYTDASNPQTLKSLNALCVRLVFCLYAEDAGLFESKSAFHDYMLSNNEENFRTDLIELFKTLDTEIEKRDPYLKESLKAFPYVNGGLFAEEGIEIPRFTKEIIKLLLEDCSEKFNWSDISPTIFGAVFESTLNPETRRSGGMHYTSLENIHKVIDNLFMNELNAEFNLIKSISQKKERTKKMLEFQEKISSLKFLDPACGSGNFLTESYISLRRLENEIIKLLYGKDKMLAISDDLVKVSLSQFYGIEINDFAVSVAKAALWIAESQMTIETEKIIDHDMNFLPLKNFGNIVEGNALELDWNTLKASAAVGTLFEIENYAQNVEKIKFDYIFGNPPFVGARMMAQGSKQKQEVERIFGNIQDVQDLDYVCCWYKKAAILIQGQNTKCAFVSTNSICQGSQVPILWNVLLNELNIHINFAYQTFIWNSESFEKAHVHCVIVGFSMSNNGEKILFIPEKTIVKNISPYLIEGDDTFVVAHKEPICNVSKMNFGNQPRDGGHFVISDEEKSEILKKEPALEKWLHPYIGAEEFIKGKSRWCLWLKNASATEILKSKILSQKVEAVRQFRLSSKAKTTNGYAKVPHLFAQITQPDDADFLIVPSVSSERRKYVPIGFCKSDVVSSNAVQIVPNATLYEFGILTSSVHMAWTRAVCGRLEMRYRYSKEIVYNTFPWANPTIEQKKNIEITAQKILDTRKKHPDCSLADLYGEKMYLFSDLVNAHNENDKAVMQAYGFNPKMTEAAIVAELMQIYKKITAQHK